jgi:DNA-binding NarL/FixJ family response regulator
MATRILVADDHEVVRRGVCALLRTRPDWEICGEAADGREALEKAQQLKPDIVVLDLGMPNLNGLETMRQILKAHPETRILILTLHDSDQFIREVLRAGARGFLLKSDAARDLITAIDSLQHHRTHFTSRAAAILLSGYLNGHGSATDTVPAGDPLTPREREVVQLIAEGKATKEVAAMLSMSVKTAETHRSNIMRKLGLHSASELVLYAVRNNIVDVTPA